MMQAVELLYAAAPDFDAAAIAARISALTGEVTTGVPGAAVTMFVHAAFVVRYADAAMPVQTVIMAAGRAPALADYDKALQQTRGFDGARAAITAAKHVFLVTEMMASGLHPPLRVEAFHAALQAIVELYPPTVLAFVYTQQMIDPADYLAPTDTPVIFRPGRMNVRFFNTGTDDFLMDTLGLEAIGLHDLQCHFRGLAPDAIMRLLYDVGGYIFENGPVFENGHTVQGPERVVAKVETGFAEQPAQITRLDPRRDSITPQQGLVPGSKWVCQFENALAAPEREVLDICPDAPFAAGNR
jgi:Domain of unknown function (DUF4261)